MEFEVISSDSPVGILKDFLRTDSLETDDEIISKSCKSRSKWRMFDRLFRIRSSVMRRTKLHSISSIPWFSDTETNSSSGDDDCNTFKSHWINYSLSDLKFATNNFSSGTK